MANLRIPARLFWPQREEKSLRHVTRVANFLDDNNGENVSSDCFKIHRSYSVSFNLSNVGKIFWFCIRKNLSLEKEKENFCVVFTYSIKRARKIKKFHEAVVQRRLRNVQKSVMHVQSCCFAKINLLLFSLLSLSIVVTLHDKTIGTFFVPFYKRLTTDFLAGKFELQACDTSVVRIKHQQTGLYVAMHKGGKVYTTLVSRHCCYMTVNSATPAYHFQFAECLDFTIELS